MEEFVQRLVRKCAMVFQDNLICILLLGSVQKEDTTPFSDIDLVAVIKTFNLSQMENIRRTLRQSERLIDLSVICRDEIPKDPNRFIIGTHGCYQLELVLKKARCVFGENILLTMPAPGEKNIKSSLLEKIIQYTWWARRMFVESNRERSLENNYQLNSRLIKMVRGLLYLADGYSIHNSAEETINYFLERYSALFSEDERKVLADLAERSAIGRNTANMSDAYLKTRFSIINKIHEEANEIINGL